MKYQWRYLILKMTWHPSSKTCHNNVIHVEKIMKLFCQNCWILKFQLSTFWISEPHLSWGGDHIHPIKASSRAFTPRIELAFHRPGAPRRSGDSEDFGAQKNGRAESCVWQPERCFIFKKKRVEAEFDGVLDFVVIWGSLHSYGMHQAQCHLQSKLCWCPKQLSKIIEVHQLSKDLKQICTTP